MHVGGEGREKREGKGDEGGEDLAHGGRLTGEKARHDLLCVYKGTACSVNVP